MKPEQTAKYYIGTAGWTYDDWSPVFYPQKQGKNFDKLTYYSSCFNTVEVNSTYYTYVAEKVAEGWLRKISDKNDFSFIIKLHQDFTHNKIINKENILKVNNILGLLKSNNRLSGLLIQFPYSFSLNNATAKYLTNLCEIFKQFNLFIEMRHLSWSAPEVLTFFRENDLCLCTIDQPQIGKSIDFNPIITNNYAYFRFHGRNEEAWLNSIANFGKKQTYEQANERYKYLYSISEITEFYLKIKEIEKSVKEIYVIMNNHPGGGAVVNAKDMINMLLQKEKDLDLFI